MSEVDDIEINNNADETTEKEGEEPGEVEEDKPYTSPEEDVDEIDEQIDSVSVEFSRRDADDIGEIPEITRPIERSSSSLTIENVKALEEATAERSDKEWSPTRYSSGRSGSGRLKKVEEDKGSRSSTPQLPPVKTGRASADLLSMASSLIQNDSVNGSRPGSQKLTGNEPLPPIGQTGDTETLDGTIRTEDMLDFGSSTFTDESSSVKPSTHPKIMQFKRELPVGYDYERENSNLSNASGKSGKTTDSSSSKKTVSFSETTDRSSSKKDPLSKTIATKEVKVIQKLDGSESMAISIGTETEWSWLDSIRVAGRIEEMEAAKPNKQETATKKSENRPPDGSGLPKRRRRRKRTSLSSSQQLSDSEGESTLSSVTGKSKESSTPVTIPETMEETAKVPDGIPPLELSSDSDSDLAELIHREQGDDLSSLMPGVGPPTILMYQRESEQSLIDCKEPVDRTIEGGMWSGTCEFCQQPIKPFPTLEMQQKYPASQLYCCEDYRQFAEFTLTNGPEASYPTDEKIDIAPHPPYGSKQARRAAKERAAQRMREREMARQRMAGANQANFYASGSTTQRNKVMEAITQKRKEGGRETVNRRESQGENKGSQSQRVGGAKEDSKRKGSTKDKPGIRDVASPRERARLIDGLVTYRGKRGSTTPSVSTTERSQRRQNGSKWEASLEVTETEVSRLQQKLIAKVDIFPEPSSLFARQMKTINYAYSSQKCRDEGWTLRPPSPLFEEAPSPEVFETEPLPPAFSVRNKVQERPLIQKYYEDGKKFLTIFSDGTGNVFYPSGNIAVVISSVKRGQYTYVVLDDHPDSAAMLAIFEPHGKGTCYYNNGIIRLNMNEYGGIFCDPNGAKKKKWNWRDLMTHVHAPPFQPITIALNKYIAVRVQTQEQIYLSINCDLRSARFNTGVKLKLVKPENIPEPDIDEDDLYIRDMSAYVQSILDKVQNVMKFSKSPKLEQIQPPLHLSHQIQRNAKLKQKQLQQKTKNKDSPLVTVN
ncbi:uncharacterized protein LOC144441971 isoform X2 [Glandiceps talaboti]